MASDDQKRILNQMLNAAKRRTGPDQALHFAFSPGARNGGLIVSVKPTTPAEQKAAKENAGGTRVHVGRVYQGAKTLTFAMKDRNAASLAKKIHGAVKDAGFSCSAVEAVTNRSLESRGRRFTS